MARVRGAWPVLVALAAAFWVTQASSGALAAAERLRDVRPQRQLWGTVVEMPTAAQLVIATPEQARLRVRLLGLEPPVPPSPAAGTGQPFGEDAVTYARGLLLDKQVMVEPHGKDKQGRLLAVVYLGEIDVNLTLVKEGLAWVQRDIADPGVRARLLVAQRQAQVAGYGLWSLPDPQPPWEYRRRHPSVR